MSKKGKSSSDRKWSTFFFTLSLQRSGNSQCKYFFLFSAPDEKFFSHGLLSFGQEEEKNNT